MSRKPKKALGGMLLSAGMQGGMALYQAHQQRKEQKELAALQAQQNRVGNIQDRLAYNPVPQYTPTFAYGGQLQQGTPQAEFQEYSGQTHAGPDQGIGVDQYGQAAAASGNPEVALTEDGEVTFDGYVFSDQLNIPGNKKRTFADEAKRIKNKHKLHLGDKLERKDKIAFNALVKELQNLREAQEEVKFASMPKEEQAQMVEQMAAEQAMQEQAMQQDMMDPSAMGVPPGQIGQEGLPMMAQGGDLSRRDLWEMWQGLKQKYPGEYYWGAKGTGNHLGNTGRRTPKDSIDCSGAMCDLFGDTMGWDKLNVGSMNMRDSFDTVFDDPSEAQHGDFVYLGPNNGRPPHIAQIVTNPETGERYIAESTGTRNQEGRNGVRLTPYDKRIQELADRGSLDYGRINRIHENYGNLPERPERNLAERPERNFSFQQMRGNSRDIYNRAARDMYNREIDTANIPEIPPGQIRQEGLPMMAQGGDSSRSGGVRRNNIPAGAIHGSEIFDAPGSTDTTPIPVRSLDTPIPQAGPTPFSQAIERHLRDPQVPIPLRKPILGPSSGREVTAMSSVSSPSLLLDRGNTEIQAHDMTSRQITPPDPVAATANFPWANVAASMIPGVIGLATDKRTPEINLGRVRMPRVNLEQARAGAREQARIAGATTRRAGQRAGATGAQQLAATGTTQANIARGVGEAYRHATLAEQEANAALIGQERMANFQTGHQERMMNWQARLGDRQRRQGIIASMARVPQQALADQRNQQATIDYLNMMGPMQLQDQYVNNPTLWERATGRHKRRGIGANSAWAAYNTSS